MDTPDRQLRDDSMPTYDPYAEIADLYDLEHGDFTDDLDLYRNLAAMIGDPILEIGCGTGRILIPLAQAGHRVTGTDASSAMLATADHAAARVGVTDRVTLSRGDMTASPPSPHGPFGLAIVALNGLLHLDAPEAQRAALRALHGALDPRGQLVLDVFNPTPEGLRALEGLHHEGTWNQANGKTVQKFSSRRVHPSSQTIETDLWYDIVAPGGALRRVSTRFPMRYVHRSELILMLEVTGFVEWQVYGSYDLEPFDDGSDRLIVTAEVTPSP